MSRWHCPQQVTRCVHNQSDCCVCVQHTAEQPVPRGSALQTMTGLTTDGSPSLRTGDDLSHTVYYADPAADLDAAQPSAALHPHSANAWVVAPESLQFGAGAAAHARQRTHNWQSVAQRPVFQPQGFVPVQRQDWRGRASHYAAEAAAVDMASVPQRNTWYERRARENAQRPDHDELLALCNALCLQPPAALAPDLPPAGSRHARAAPAAAGRAQRPAQSKGVTGVVPAVHNAAAASRHDFSEAVAPVDALRIADRVAPQPPAPASEELLRRCAAEPAMRDVAHESSPEAVLLRLQGYDAGRHDVHTPMSEGAGSRDFLPPLKCEVLPDAAAAARAMLAGVPAPQAAGAAGRSMPPEATEAGCVQRLNALSQLHPASSAQANPDARAHVQTLSGPSAPCDASVIALDKLEAASSGGSSAMLGTGGLALWDASAQTRGEEQERSGGDES